MNKIKLASKTQIYLDTRKLLDIVFDITPNFPRVYRYSVGCKMHDITINLMHEISEAYINKDREKRVQCLLDFQADFETLKTLVRISGERRWIKGTGKLAEIVMLMDNIGKQATAWKNSLLSVSKANTNSEN